VLIFLPIHISSPTSIRMQGTAEKEKDRVKERKKDTAFAIKEGTGIIIRGRGEEESG